jgi:uncharacterized protein with NAD-binding domain and iron-sulfur cluster
MMADGPAAPVKVAILGGGMAALAAAFEITNSPGYEVTIYTLGWRLGGKCASSRGPDARIQEHGIHGFLGSYYNANVMLARVYDQLKRDPQAPLPTFESAMVGMDALQMYRGPTRSEMLNLEFPANDLNPADPTVALTVEELVDALIAWAEGLKPPPGSHPVLDAIAALWRDVAQACSAGRATGAPHGPDHPLLGALEGGMARVADAVGGVLAGGQDYAQYVSILDWAKGLVKGALVEKVAVNGFDGLDTQNWKEWLGKYVTFQDTLEQPIALNTVNLAYQYPAGDTNREAMMGAGAYLHWSLRALGYCGHAIYAFAAGTGETVIAPFYQLLKNRGVKFEFFSKVEQLNLSADKSSIASVQIGVQATLKPQYSEYQPLMVPAPKDLPSWPDRPNFEQLEQGDDPDFRKADLESWWTSWKPVSTRTLVAGQDYDRLVFALSVGAVPFVCPPELFVAQPRWQQMVDALPVVRTQAFQIWMQPTREELGFPVTLTGNNTALSDTYVPPFDGHCEMGHILRWEGWDPADPPGSLWYFCDELPHEGPFPPFSDTGYPARMADMVKANAIVYLDQAMGRLMPLGINKASGGKGLPGALNYALLQGALPGAGAEAFDTQFWRANIDPTETYVQTPPGSTRYRLKAWDTGFSNLVVAGDWTYTGLNVGSVECAVMSGRLASHAITGLPALADIPGYPAPKT